MPSQGGDLRFIAIKPVGIILLGEGLSLPQSLHQQLVQGRDKDGDADSITRHRVIFQPSVSTSDLPAITINDNNYNSDLHNAFQITKHTGTQDITSSLVYTCELRLPNFTLHLMEKPRKV